MRGVLLRASHLFVRRPDIHAGNKIACESVSKMLGMFME